MSRLERRQEYFVTEDERYAHLSGIELMRMRVETERMELIPINQIVLEGSITDDHHIKILADSMQGPRGQISPITVRARDIGLDYLHYDIIDGFHRVPALQSIAIMQAKAVVMYGCSNEEMFDLRITAASSVRSVQFARVARWMQYSFAETDWGKKISLTQAFYLEEMNVNTAKRLGLSETETAAVREWVRSKAAIWQKPVGTIYQDIRAIDAASPSLLLNVRVGGGGKKSKKGSLNPTQFKAIVFPLAGEHELQHEVASIVTKEALTAQDAQTLAQEIAKVKDSEEAVAKILNDPFKVFETYEPREKASLFSFKKRTEGLSVSSVATSHNLTEEESRRLKALASQAEEEGDTDKLALILGDPAFFVRELKRKPKEVTTREQAEHERLGKHKYSRRRLLPEQINIPRRVSELEEQVENYLEIIDKQNKLIERLEAGSDGKVGSEKTLNSAEFVLSERPWGDIVFDTIDGQIGAEEIGYVRLTPKEKSMFRILVRYADSPVSHRGMMMMVGDGIYVDSDKEIVYVTVSRIRTKLRKLSPLLASRLRSVPGSYVWDKEVVP